MDVYNIIKKQRKSVVSPVDTMGCFSVGKGYTGDAKKFQILVGLLLSSQTRDEVTYAAIISLRMQLGELTPENILKYPIEVINRCIEKVGFHNKKTKYLIEIAKIVKNGMPSTLLDTLKLPGIGKKMAYLYLFHGCEQNEGIGVDTHVHRISNRIGLVKSKAPEETRIQLESRINKDEWQNLNSVMVGFGQKICLPINPKCSLCKAKKICPTGISSEKC